MKLLLPMAMLGTLALLPFRVSGATVLTFEGLKDQERILNFYNGGTGSMGSGPGSNFGITFTSDSLAIISNTVGGQGNFDGNPSGNTVAFFLTGAGDIMNVSAGFTTGFSFYYSAPGFAGTVAVFDGINGSGTQLATLTLPTTPAGKGSGSCNSTDDYCPWVPFGVTFTGTAMSAVFSGTANYIGFDDITLGSATPGIPEPGALFLVSAGIAGLGLIKRRRG